jgi:hypothetical protein
VIDLAAVFNVRDIWHDFAKQAEGGSDLAWRHFDSAKHVFFKAFYNSASANAGAHCVDVHGALSTALEHAFDASHSAKRR